MMHKLKVRIASWLYFQWVVKPVMDAAKQVIDKTYLLNELQSLQVSLTEHTATETPTRVH